MLLVSGLYFFKRMEDTFADVVLTMSDVAIALRT